MYVCEYLAARHNLEAVKAMLRENPLGLRRETTPAQVYRRMLWSDCCGLVKQLENNDSSNSVKGGGCENAYETLKQCADVLDRLLEVQQDTRHEFNEGFALAAFDVLYQGLFRAYGTHGDSARLAADVADLVQRCFRSQALLRTAQAALEGTVAAALLRRDRGAFAALAACARRHGVAALASSLAQYLREVEPQLAEPLVVQALRGIVRGTHAPVPASPDPAVAAAANTETAAEKRKKRKSFSAEETANLEEGVRRCGVGRWKEILALYPFGGRTAVDLKDKWRNIVNKRAREEQATQASQAQSSQPQAQTQPSSQGSASASATPSKRKRVGITEDSLMALLTPPSSQPRPEKNKDKDEEKDESEEEDNDSEILSLACPDGTGEGSVHGSSGEDDDNNDDDDDDIDDLLATQV